MYGFMGRSPNVSLQMLVIGLGAVLIVIGMFSYLHCSRRAKELSGPEPGTWTY